MKKELNVISVTPLSRRIVGPLAIINLYLVFFGSLIFVGLGAKIFGYGSLVLWLVWQLLFVNVILPEIEKRKKPKLVYNTRTKKLKYYHHIFQFRTFKKGNDVQLYAPGSKKEVAIYYTFREDLNSITVSIQLDKGDYEIIKQIQKDWYGQ